MASWNRHQVWLIVFIILIFSGAGWSDEAVPVGYRSIAAERGIPNTLLYAIALTESGQQLKPADVYRPWPWTLNIAGRGYFFDSRLAAWQALTVSLQAGQQSVDIGLMQVNWRYHQDRLGSPWQALEPYHNLRVGAEILQDCYENKHDWWTSVGCYHAPKNHQRADQYRRRVVSRWQRIKRAG
jgi:hypothetical protein